MAPETKICVICEKPITADANGWEGGHNAQPVAKGQCCNDCNARHVEPAQYKQAGYSQTEANIIAITKKYREN